MSSEPPAKRARHGTKSCIECRRRKVRCVWPSPSAECCEYCQARGLTCEHQVAPTPNTDRNLVTTRARLTNLERNVSCIWSSIRALQNKTGIEESSQQHRDTGSSMNDQRTDVYDDSDDDSSEDLTTLNAPAHLLQLFHNPLLSAYSNDAAPTSSGQPSPQQRSVLQQRSQGAAELRALLPRREDMVIIAPYSTSWLKLYYPVFAIVSVSRTPEQMLSEYDRLHKDSTDPVALTTLLLSIAITVQHHPKDIAAKIPGGFRDLPAFFKEVADTVDRVVIVDDALAGSVLGIEIFLLFIRFQMGRAKVSKVWLRLRRAIALAEINGLPRAVTILDNMKDPANRLNVASMQQNSIEQLKQKADLWESLLTVDRICSAIWSLPLATANFTWSKRPVVDDQGRVILKVYLYYLGDLAQGVLEIDTMLASGRPFNEIFDVVLRTDNELQALLAYLPKQWWRKQNSELSMDSVLQFWTLYMKVRTHIQLALAYDENQRQFASNFIACLNTCQDLADRYIVLKPLLPPGFFANWLIELQAFTSVIFLLLAKHRVTSSAGTIAFPQHINAPQITRLVDQVVEIMTSNTGHATDSFSHPAANAIKSLDRLLRASSTQDAQHISLNIPLVGTIQIHKNHAEATNGRPEPNLKPTTIQRPTLDGSMGQEAPTFNDEVAAQNLVPTSDYFEGADLLSYSMEIPESYPLFTEDMFGSEQWLTWTQ